MTARERVLAALDHCAPDRTPRDFWAEGRSRENLGLAGMTVEEMQEYVNTGVRRSSADP